MNETRTIHSRCLAFLTILLFHAATVQGEPPCKPVKLRCEYLEDPIGVDVPHPRLSWRIDDLRKGARQTAWQLCVGTDSAAVAEGRGDAWNTSKMTSEVNIVRYEGTELRPFTVYYWQVRVWDKNGLPAMAGIVSRFETGMMKASNWQGAWIADNNDIHLKPAPYFRKAFTAKKEISTARVYIAAAGLYELSLNGERVGNHRLDPAFTRFDRRILYVTHDVTAFIRSGENAIGVLLGNGWYNHQPEAVWFFDKAPWRNRPAFCLDLRIVYKDGSSETVSSGSSWKTALSPVILNSIYTGEHYDARLEQKGWDLPAFDDSKWNNVVYRGAPSMNIVSQMMHPIRATEKIPARSVKKFSDTCYVFDLGRNISGVSRIRLDGPAGTIVKLKHGERLLKNGRVDLSNIDIYYLPKDNHDPFATDIVILSGNGPVDFMPRFNYKGFQYVEVTSTASLKLNKKDLEGYFMHSDVPVVGVVSSSDSLINRLWRATNNSYLSNLFGYPTDCPQREKNGWTGDGHFAVETGLYNFDGITVYEKWLADHRDEQQPNGVLPDIIPTGGWGYGTANGTDWTSTIAIIPWTLYLFYGDSGPLADSYDNIRRYLTYIERISPSGLTTFGRGDWVPVKSKSSLEYTSSVYYYTDAAILAKTAGLLGKHEDHTYYSALAEKIKTAINSKYLNQQTGIYGSGTQTELSMALQWGIVPPELKHKVAENLAEKVKANDMHLDVGVLGARAILSALSDNGQAETAYQLAVQNTYPSWGWWIVNGATTLYENWDIAAARDISLNHMMFGDIGGWFFRGLGGIKPDEKNPGFRNSFITPYFAPGLNAFSASHDTPYGMITSAWKRQGNKVIWTLTVPPGATADVMLPVPVNQRLYSDGKIMAEHRFKAEAGTYRFEIK